MTAGSPGGPDHEPGPRDRESDPSAGLDHANGAEPRHQDAARAGPTDVGDTTSPAGGRDAGRLAGQWSGWWRKVWHTWWRSPREIEKVGDTPDYRFTLANERTFLAWVRTALALLAAGVAVVQLVPGFSVPGARHVLGIPLVVLSVIVSSAGYRHWADRERSMRTRQPLPVPGLPRVLAMVVGAAGLAALVFILIGHSR
ncbi:MAG: YidH family protein [Frankia sp.]